jgi:hypothetical protein
MNSFVCPFKTRFCFLRFVCRRTNTIRTICSLKFVRGRTNTIQLSLAVSENLQSSMIVQVCKYNILCENSSGLNFHWAYVFCIEIWDICRLFAHFVKICSANISKYYWYSINLIEKLWLYGVFLIDISTSRYIIQIFAQCDSWISMADTAWGNVKINGHWEGIRTFSREGNRLKQGKHHKSLKNMTFSESVRLLSYKFPFSKSNAEKHSYLIGLSRCHMQFGFTDIRHWYYHPKLENQMSYFVSVSLAFL